MHHQRCHDFEHCRRRDRARYFAIGTWNLLTNPLGAGGAALGVPNPFAIDPIPYSSAKQTAYGISSEIGTGIGLGFGGSSIIAARSSTLSVVPAHFQVETPYGTAIQGVSAEAQAARESVLGATLYRRGPQGVSEGAEAQFWSLESPLSSGYAGRTGLPSSSTNFNFVEAGTLKPGQSFVTRHSPGIEAAERVKNALYISSVVTEVFMALRQELANLLDSKIKLESGIRDKISEAISDIGIALR